MEACKRSHCFRDIYDQTQFNKTYTGNLENTRRTAWEQNLVEIYKHNLMAAAGHHSYTLRDNHIADLNTRQYMRDMVGNSNEPICIFSETKF